MNDVVDIGAIFKRLAAEGKRENHHWRSGRPPCPGRARRHRPLGPARRHHGDGDRLEWQFRRRLSGAHDFSRGGAMLCSSRGCRTSGDVIQRCGGNPFQISTYLLLKPTKLAAKFFTSAGRG
jgi:hypothetical protein